MGDFRKWDFDYRDMSLEEGYRIWRDCEGRRAQIGYGYTCIGTVHPGPHWTGRWVDTRGMGNHGTHIMLPVSREARRLVRIHQTQCWAHQYGISYQQADRLYDFRGPHKYELIADICAAINDVACHDAFLRFPGVGPGLHHAWYRRWEDVVAPYLGHSWPRNAALIDAVCYVVGHAVHA